MHGDFTRDTFDRSLHYNSVRHQQGRVQLDAEFNEQADITNYLERSANTDQIGPSGAPFTPPNEFKHFKLAGNSLVDLEIAPGHFYAAGILLENEKTIKANAQPYLPAGAPIVNLNPTTEQWVTLANAVNGQYLAYLQVTSRHLTQIQQPDLREVALGGPDTSTRLQTNWQLRLVKTDGNQVCNTVDGLLPKPGRGRLTSSEKIPAPQTDPCEPGGTGGYSGLENHLYRVEIHKGGGLGTATFKWSRENGSVMIAVEDFIPDQVDPNKFFKVQVASLGRDEVLGLAENDWVELIDDHDEFLGQPGVLAQIKDIQSSLDSGYNIELSLDVAGHKPTGNDPRIRHPYLRRWDQVKDVQVDGSLKTSGSELELESGVLVKFEVENGSGPVFQPGDYWFFTARTLSGVEKITKAPPRGSKLYAAVGLIDWQSPVLKVTDCRPLFPYATELVQFLYVGGDGQSGKGGQVLPAPLQVSVTNGQYPVVGARVLFTPGQDSGTVNLPTHIETGPDGIASCKWTLSSTNTGLQTVEARLMLPDSKDNAPHPATNPLIRFSAGLTPAGNGQRCCLLIDPSGKGDYKGLAEAFHDLVNKQKKVNICLCLLPGEHDFQGFQTGHDRKNGDLHIRIHGSGAGSRVRLIEPFQITGAASVILEDFTLETTFLVSDLMQAVAFDNCDEVALRGISISGVTEQNDGDQARGALLGITACSIVHLRDLTLEAAMIGSFDPLLNASNQLGIAILVDIMQAAQAGPMDFWKKALDTGRQIMSMSNSGRKKLSSQLTDLMNFPFLPIEQGNFMKLSRLVAENGGPEEVFASLFVDIRRAAILANPGAALVLDTFPETDGFSKLHLGTIGRDGFISLESSQVVGQIGLYGLPLSLRAFNNILPQPALDNLQKNMQTGGIVLESRALHLGTLALRGNQLGPIGLSRLVTEVLAKTFDDPRRVGLYNEILLDNNVFLSGPLVVAASYIGATGNHLAIPPTDMIGVFIAQSLIGTNNRGQGRQVRNAAAEVAVNPNLPRNLIS